MQIRRTTGFIVLSLFTAFFLAACGGGGGGGAAAPLPVPEVTTASASSISVDNAVLNGTVIPSGLATTYWFEWGTSSTLATYDNTSSQSAGSGTAAVAVSGSITGLSQATTYYYRLAALNSSGTTKGAIASLTTASPMNPPTVQTIAFDNLSISGATLHANVIPNGLATTAWFEWGTDNTFAIPNVTPTQSVGSDNTSHQVNAVLTDLTTGTNYYYRVVANNSVGTSRGLTASFTTNTLAPTVVTVPASPVGTDNALLKGTVNPNGLATNYHFEWGTDSALNSPNATPTLSAGLGTGDVSVSAAISSLLEATPYYFRVVATNSTGTSQGTIRLFTTLQNPPPTANAGPGQTVFMRGGAGATVVRLDGSGSTDPYGTITSYLWTQLSGTTVSLDNSTSATPIFTAPAVAYPGEDLQFQLTVTDNRGLSGTDNVKVTVKWGYFDDFSTDTTGSYSVNDFGTGATFTYATGGTPPGGRTFVDSRLGKSITVFHSFGVPASYTGVFSLDFCPSAKSSPGGQFQLRIMDDNDTYFLVTNYDWDNPGDPHPVAKVSKFRATVEVDNAVLATPYSQGNCYPIKITYTPTKNTFEVFGETIDLTINTSPFGINSFDIKLTDQDAYLDNIKMEPAP